MHEAPRFALSLALGSLLAVNIARADQFLLTDVAYTHSTTTTKDSHYHVVPLAGAPKSWSSPVDYSNGSAYVRVEVKTKPAGAAPTRFQICFEGAPAYACTAQSKVYTTTGVLEWTTPFSEFYKGEGVGVDWSKGVAKVALILKDDMNGKPAPENTDAGIVAKYMPTDLHVVVGIVTPGATFKLPPNVGGPDAGAADAGKGDASSGDASAGDAGSSAADASGDAAPQPTDAALAVDAQAPRQDAGASVDAAATGDASPTTDAGAAQRDAAPDDEDDKAASADGGCSLQARAPVGLSGWSIALLGVLTLARRRRTRGA